MDEELYYLGFSLFLGIGPVRFSLIKNRFKTAERGYYANKNDLGKLIGLGLAEKFINFRSKLDLNKIKLELKKKNIDFISQINPFYPQSLKNIPDSPIGIYTKGNKQLLKDSKKIFFGIVGTRKPSSYGEIITKKITHQLVDLGFIIVSGMALGIDSIAHWTTVNNNGLTIAVLGCGVDVIYPSSNCHLYQKIIEKDGLIISEFPPGHRVSKGLFISRNRLIAGLSSGILVIEGNKNSGALTTARYALEQGKEVFAPPAPITYEQSEAPNLLLKQGAKLVTNINDILEEFNVKINQPKINIQKQHLSKDELQIFELLERNNLLVDEIVIFLKKPVTEILNLLSQMELKGLIEKNNQGQYQIKI